MKLISSNVKDKILFYLCEHTKLEQLSAGNTNEVLNELEVDFYTFNAIMAQFQRFGFIEKLDLRTSHMAFVLRAEAHDFVQKGGFSIQDEIFKANFEKLDFEIKNLQKQLGPDKLDSVSKISTIIQTLLAGLSLLNK